MDIKTEVPHRAPVPLFLPLHPTNGMGPHVQETDGPQLRQPHQGPGPAQLFEVEIPGPALPEDLFPLASDVALELVFPRTTEVSRHLVGQNPLGLGTEAPESDVESILIEENGHLGPLGHRRSEIQLPLGEVRDALGAAPGGHPGRWAPRCEEPGWSRARWSGHGVTYRPRIQPPLGG